MTRVWLRWSRRLFPSSVWSGAGIIVGKDHLDEAPASAMLGATIRVSEVVPARWILVVLDTANDEKHYVNVTRSVWDDHDVGDVISADDPLVNLP